MSDPLTQLATYCKTDWPNLVHARQQALGKQAELHNLLSNAKPRLLADDRSFVVFGSLARREWTNSSDLDWTLLIDGYCSADHVVVKQEIEKALDATTFKKPGGTRLFGEAAFSHEIINQIGGQADTNRNTTQRILLLLESIALGDVQSSHERVLRAVLNRYLQESSQLLTRDGASYRVPRFLLNYIVRFWRTMGVDFASKQRERGGQGWGLRNAKLRLSRKLIFVSGLLTCYSCMTLSAPSPAPANPAEAVIPLQAYLYERLRLTPTDVLAQALLQHAVAPEVARQIFGAYDKFLHLLNDEQARKHLDGLRSDQAAKDPVFQQVEEISTAFQDGLDVLFFDTPGLQQFTRKYGVF